MPRDDLSIDFVKKMAPPVEAQDPGLVLDDWINRVQNLPEEIRFLQDEIADKDRDFHEIVKSASENDEKMQRHYRQHGNATPFPRENQTREIIRQAYIRADKIAVEKITLSQKMQSLYDKHLRYLDAQLKQLGDRAEPGFTDPDEIPSLLRPSAANNSNTSIRVLAAAAGAASAQASKSLLTPITTNTPAAGRAANAQSRAAQASVNGSSSVPTTPVGNILINRNQRESSAGPGGTAPKRGPRASSNLGNVATASSGLGRQSSLGPGTPKAGTPGANSRAGSAGPRTNNKNPGGSRKGTPTGGVARKKAQPKSTLSRVKRAGNTKGSPSSNADSELSDADSVPSSRGGRGSRAGSGTPAPSASTNKNHNSTAPASAATPSGTASGPATGQEATADADEDMPDAPEEEEEEEGSISVASEPEDDEEEDEEGKKYCFCQHVSYGDMVACDNDSCPYEWFHWNCVGLKSTPEGTWYCPSCEENRGKKDSGNKEGAGSVPTGNKKNK